MFFTFFVAKVLVRHGDLVLHLVEYTAGYVDAPTLGEGLNASCDVDPVTEQVVTLDNHVAQIDSNAKLHPPILSGILIALGQVALHANSAINSVNGAWELDQEPITRRPNNPTPMLANSGVNDLLTVILELAERSCFVNAHEATVARHVGT